MPDSIADSNIIVSAKRLGWDGSMDSPSDYDDYDSYSSDEHGGDDLVGELITRQLQEIVLDGRVFVPTRTQYLVGGHEADPSTIEPIDSSMKHITPSHGPGDQDVHGGEGTTRQKIERVLATGEILVVSHLGGGVCDSYLMSVGGVDAVVKPARGISKKIRQHIPIRSEPKREVAAYILDQEIGGIAGVPPTVLRNISAKEHSPSRGVASVQEYRRNMENGYYSVGSYPQSERYKMTFFDGLIGNMDRHSGNFLLRSGGKPNTARITPIDHGLSFPISNKVDGYGGNFVFSSKAGLPSYDLLGEHRTALEGLRTKFDTVAKRLFPLIGARAIGALRERIDMMLSSNRYLSYDHGNYSLEGTGWTPIQ